jgi:hypothetical protein
VALGCPAYKEGRIARPSVRALRTVARLAVSMLCFGIVARCTVWLFALDTVVIERDNRLVELTGTVLVEAKDGGVLLLGLDGQMWPLQPSQIKERKRDERPFEPWNRQQLAEKLQEELPGFSLFHTQHYLIAYNTSQAYAQWCGSLYERLHKAFFNYWKTRGWELDSPQTPLIALVFDTRASFREYSRPLLGDAVGTVIGYYDMKSNRIVMYDLTGADELKRLNPRIRNSTFINQILAQPEAERMVATIVHEAVHQLAYNSGLQTRFAGNPMWVSEGIAAFFETPDFRDDRGWRTVGVVNTVHWKRFRESPGTRDADWFVRLLTDDRRFHSPATMADAYAEAWALNYFLLNRRSAQYVAYLKQTATLEPLEELSPAERLARFTQAMGDLEALRRDFLSFMARVRP